MPRVEGLGGPLRYEPEFAATYADRLGNVFQEPGRHEDVYISHWDPPSLGELGRRGVVFRDVEELLGVGLHSLAPGRSNITLFKSSMRIMKWFRTFLAGRTPARIQA